MSKSDSASNGERLRRVRTDPLFYVVMSLIGATYVVLIVMMLAADAIYIFTSDMRKYVILDFAVYGADELFEEQDVVADQFANYGLSVSVDGDGKAAMILSSRQPPEHHESLGTPNRRFGGPGIGAGGGLEEGEKNPAKNVVPQGNVLVVSDDIERLIPSATGGRLLFNWSDPIHVNEVHLLDIDRTGGVITTFGRDALPIRAYEIPALGANSFQVIKVDDAEVAQMAIDLPCSGAVTEVSFRWAGHIRQPWERDHPALAKLVHNPITASLAKPEIQYSIKLSLISCTITAILSLWVAVPIGYLMSRHRFFGRNLVDAILDIPIVLPPLVVGLSLLIMFQFLPRSVREAVVYEIPAVILAQFMVACAFAVRTMRATFDQIDSRREQVALTLGCSRFQAFGMVVLPEATRGMLTAGTLAWARALGEFGPLLIFAGATRNKTEVLSTTVFLELSIGDLGAACAVSLIMVFAAVIVLVVARLWGNRSLAL